MNEHVQWRSDLATRMADRSPALVEELVDVLGRRLRAIRVLDVDAQSLRASVGDNIAVLTHLIDGPSDRGAVPPPVRAQTLVRRLAQHGMPLYDILDAYYFSEKQWVQACMDEIFALSIPLDAARSAAVEIWNDSHDYVEQVCRLLAWEHETERGRIRHGGDSQRARAVATLLDGAPDKFPEAEAVLGYPLRNRQLAAVLWSVGGDGLDEAAQLTHQFDRAVTLLSASMNSLGAPLVIFRDDMTRWVWLPIPRAQIMDLTDLEHAMARDCPLVRVAVGSPGDEHAGFTESHRQARIAHEIGLMATPSHTLIPYQTVSSLMFLVNDLVRAKIWVRETLGVLAVDSPRARELRDTLAAYMRHNRSISAAATELSCHRNTVHYRVGVAETALGYRVTDRPHDLAIALLACTWLGDAVLQPSNHD
jgi:PucR C-terminal helix-turn-helix domain/GGDEF-like domain